MTHTHVNPDALFASPYFSQAVLAEGARTLYIGGQNGADATGAISGGMREQTAQAYRNIKAILESVGAGPEHVVRIGILMTAEASIDEGLAGSEDGWGDWPTASTIARVVGLARPEALVEIEATAVLP
jgi:enamine deaminase RidA (YjgF/YER057c/UK114 family)